MKEAVSQSCSGKGVTATGSDHVLLQHLALVTDSVIHEVSVSLPDGFKGLHRNLMPSAPASTGEASCSTLSV